MPQIDKIETVLRNFIQELNTNKKYKLIPANPEKRKDANDYDCNIYNEISFQHELGKYIEEKLENEGYKVFYEKNMYDTIEEREEKGWVKKEADIVIINKNNNEKYAIELKFSKGENARTSVVLYDYIKDIRFMELVKSENKFTNVYNFMIANSQKYYKYELNKNESKIKYNIYEMFRKETNNKNKRRYSIPQKPKEIEKYCRPTATKKKKEEKEFTLDRPYSGTWEMLFENDQDNDETKFQYRYILINHKNVENN